MAKKYSKSKSSQSGGKAGKRKGSTRKKSISKKKIALFKHYMGAKPEAEQPVNLNRSPSETPRRR